MPKSKHQEVADHYEKFPYPDYPLYAYGSWKELSSVDISTWGLSRPAKDLWICGSGTIAPLMFARRNPKLRILATDLSEATLRIAKRRLWIYGFHQVRCVRADLFASTYRESFDAIDAYGVIHHTTDPKHALKILGEALRPGGVLRMMIYSKQARKQIEDLRAEVKEHRISEFGELKMFLKTKNIPLKGDLSGRSGLADALLHPLVHVFDEESVDKLLSHSQGIKLQSLKSSGNHILFLKKS